VLQGRLVRNSNREENGRYEDLQQDPLRGQPFHVLICRSILIVLLGSARDRDFLTGEVITYNIFKPHLEEAIECNTLNVRNWRVRLDGGCCRFYGRKRRLLLSSRLSIGQRGSDKQSCDGRLHLEDLFAMYGEKTNEAMINREKISRLR
jgi:hypothetical protein